MERAHTHARKRARRWSVSFCVCLFFVAVRARRTKVLLAARAQARTSTNLSSLIVNKLVRRECESFFLLLFRQKYFILSCVERKIFQLSAKNYFSREGEKKSKGGKENWSKRQATNKLLNQRTNILITDLQRFSSAARSSGNSEQQRSASGKRNSVNRR